MYFKKLSYFLNVLLFLVFCFTIFKGVVHGAFAQSIEQNLPIHEGTPTAYFTLWKEEGIEMNYTLRKLSEKLRAMGYNIVPSAPNQFNDNDLNIVAWKFFSLPPLEMKTRSYLWLLESPIGLQIPPPEKYKDHFNKIFTWYRPLADGKKVIYVPIPCQYHKVLKNYNVNSKEYLVSQVAMHWKGWNYQLREQSVIWFLENHPNDIRFFGNFWEEIYPKLSEKTKVKFNETYGGYVEDKIDEISKAKFVLAYENIRFEDYVSEKIYEAMAAGSVPIYSGAPNISDYVPKECFIDFQAFQNHEELYRYLTTMSDDTYNGYLKCIADFMKDPEVLENHPKRVAQKIFEHLEIIRN